MKLGMEMPVKNFVLNVAPVAALLGICLTAPASAQMVAFYQFNNASNLGLDSSGQGNNLVAFGSGVAYTANGMSGGGLSLSGSGGLTTLNNMVPADFPTGDTAYTLSVSFDAATVGGVMGFLGWGNYGSTNQVNAFRLGKGGADGTLVNYWWGSDMRASPTILANTWYTATVSFNGTTRNMYLNGILVASDTPGVDAAAGDNFSIGVTNSTEYFDGVLDNVAIFNTALTPAQVAADEAQMVPEPAGTFSFVVGVAGLALLRGRRRTAGS
jgi:hypothetical protein